MLTVFCAECRLHLRGPADGRYIGTVCEGCKAAGRDESERVEQMLRDDVLARAAGQARVGSGPAARAAVSGVC